MAKPPNAPLRRSPWRTSRATQDRLDKRSLRWIDVDRIAQTLSKNFPNTDLDLLPDIDLTHYIIALPNFSDPPRPPNGVYIDLIRAAWNALREPLSTPATTEPKVTAS